MSSVLMYCTAGCPYCHSAERLLTEKGVGEIEKIRVDLEPQRRSEMIARCGRTSVPQIWIGEVYVGGSDDLHALERAGKLDALLAPVPSQR